MAELLQQQGGALRGKRVLELGAGTGIGGLSAAPKLGDVVGWRLTSSFRKSGDFSCSDDMISKIYSTTVNNYQGITTGGQTVDCPHRERRGYGGDGHTSYQFARANFQVGAYFTK